MRFAGSLDVTGFSIIGAMLHPVSSDPGGLGSGDAGRVWFNTTTGRLMVWNGTAPVDLLDLGSATGSITASKVSDLAAVVKAYRLDEFAAPTADINLNSRKITSLADGVGANDGINKGQLDAALSGLASGQVLKGSVRVAATTNISIASAPASIDGVTLTNGDVVLLTGQTTASQNGPRVFTAAGAALARATNWDTSGEAALGSYWIVREGSNADTFALLTNDTAVTLDTTALTFVFRGSAGASYTAGAGIGLSGTDFSVGAGDGLSQAADGLLVDPAITARKRGGSVPATTSGIFTVSGQNVTVNHGLNNDVPQVSVIVGSSPVSGFTANEPVIVNYVRVDANNTMFTFPGTLAANQWIVGIVG